MLLRYSCNYSQTVCANSRKFQKLKPWALNLCNHKLTIAQELVNFNKKGVEVGRIVLAQVQVCMTMRKLEASPNEQIVFQGK